MSDFKMLKYVETSSGFESFSPNNEYNDKEFVNAKASSNLKRPIEVNFSKQVTKKLRVDEDNIENQEQECLENDVSIFESTLDSVNVTKIIENTEEKENAKKSDEFDAFETFLFCTSDKDTDQELSTTNINSPSSTVFNTQVINHLENITKNDKLNLDEQDCGITLLHSFAERMKSKSLNKPVDEEIVERTILFEDEKITNQYLIEVDNMFDKIEQSVFTMGIEKNETLPDELLNVIFNGSFKQQIDQDNSTTAELSETVLNKSNFSKSFCSIIKQALQNNTHKQVQSKKDKSFTNISDKRRDYCCLGPFYGLPIKIKELIVQYKGIEELYDWQDECLSLPAIQAKKNLIYALPTSGGKTLVAEILIFREIMCYGGNVIFIMPYVSIVQEKVWALSPFGVALDFLIEEYASNKGTYPPRKRRRKKSVYIATIEKALGIINSLIENDRLHEIGLIIVDELHLIGEEGRGSTLEACLTKVKFLKANIQIVGMSATIGNLKEICKFLNADTYTKNFRPVELVEYIKCGSEIAKVNWNYTDEKDLLIDTKKINYKYSDSLLKMDPDMLGGLVMDIIPDKSCLVFCASKKNCENVTQLLCKLCKPVLKNHLKSEKQQLIHALKDESGDLCDILRLSVQYGIAYHHSGLTSDERKIIEEGFRAGILCVICCTSTLAAGVNLPAQRVILRAPYIGRDFINLSRYKQMVGRAGRTGLGEAGDSILITQAVDLPKVRKLLMSSMSSSFSSMHLNDGRGLRHFLLSCISLNIANTRKQLQDVVSFTLLSVQAEKLGVNLKKLTDSVIKNLFKLGALKESCGKVKREVYEPLVDVSVKMNTTLSENMDASLQERREPSTPKKTIVLSNDTKLVVSELGCAAIKGGLELSRAHLLYEDLYKAQASLVLRSHLHLLYLVTPYDTAEQIRPNMQVYYDLFTKLSPKDLQVAKIIGINESVAVKMLSNNPPKNVPERVLNRFYVTLMLYDLWKEMPVFQVSQKYQTNRGIVQHLMTTAATFASNVVNFCEELEEFWAYSHLLKGMSQRLSHCCVRELLPLMELPAVKQSRAKQLYNAGYKTLQSIAKTNANDLIEKIEYMSKRVANQLIAAAKMLLLERIENLREQAEEVLEGVDNS